MEIMFAGSGWAQDVKKVEITMLSPANGQAVKYILSPAEAVSCRMGLRSLLKILLICYAPKKTDA